MNSLECMNKILAVAVELVSVCTGSFDTNLLSQDNTIITFLHKEYYCHSKLFRELENCYQKQKTFSKRSHKRELDCELVQSALF